MPEKAIGRAALPGSFVAICLSRFLTQLGSAKSGGPEVRACAVLCLLQFRENPFLDPFYARDGKRVEAARLNYA